VASVNCGCRAIATSSGIVSALLRDAMSRAPVIKLPSPKRVAELSRSSRQLPILRIRLLFSIGGQSSTPLYYYALLSLK
jgi:hypothetical protein